MAIPDQNALTWTTAELLTELRQKARIPAGTLDYTDAILLNEATQQQWSFAGWAISKSGDGRLLSTLARTSTSFFSTPYAGLRDFNLPWDAVGDTFDSVFWLDLGSNTERRLDVIDLSSQPLYDTPISQGMPWGYSVIDGRLRIYPKPAAAGRARINYQRRLPKLVPDTEARTVTSNSYTATYAEVIYGGTQLIMTVGDYFDVYAATYPHRNLMPNAQATGGTLAANTVQSSTYNQDTWTGLVSGNVIARSGTCPYVLLPLEFRACFTCRVASEVLTQIGDSTGAAIRMQEAERELDRVISMMNPRSQSTRTKVVNPYSLMRARRWLRSGAV